MNRTAMALVAGTIVVASLAGAAAQSNDQFGRGWGMGGMMMGGHMMGFGAEGMLDRIDGRLAFIKAELKIRDDQAAQWDSLAKVIRDNAETHNEMMRSMMEDMHSGEYAQNPLPERLTLMETRMEAMLEQIRSVHGALDNLYAVLDDDQKKAADEVVMPVMGMGMGMGMMKR